MNRVRSAKLYLFGAPRVELAGEPVAVPRRKALALLAYLARTGRVHSRDGLTGLLWPDASPARSRANLRNLLWLLKEAGLGRYLDIGTTSLSLAAGDRWWIDVRSFDRRTAAAALRRTRAPKLDHRTLTGLQQAVRLYQGDFLAGFALKDAFAFEEWQLAEEDRLRERLALVLETLVGHFEAQGEHRKALRFVKRWLDLDPLDESVLLRRVALHERLGQTAEALRVLQEADIRFQRELGVAPSEELQARGARLLRRRAAAPAPAPPAGTPRLWRLPSPPTAFVGREPELQTLDAWARDEGERLLTILGPGGTGKTRLAIEAARRTGERFADGVCFVSLAAAPDATQFTLALAETLQVPSSDPAPQRPGNGAEAALRRRLFEFLRRKHLLLVLDNLEHLTADTDLILSMLVQAPQVRVLATSRETLGLPGEGVLRLEGLTQPRRDAQGRDWRQSSGVELFLRTARRVRRGYRPTRADREDITALLGRIEGNPLGIELAAAWMNTLSPAEIASAVAADTDFLRSSRSDLPDRHRSLRTVFEHSWGRLTRREQDALAHLSACPGPLSAASARAVATTDAQTLTALVDKSLLRRHENGTLGLHEVLRAYAGEHLGAGARTRTKERLVRHYLNWLAEAGPELKGPRVARMLDRLAREQENLRLAWTCALRDRRWRLLRRAFLAYFLFFDIRSRFAEGADVFRESIEQAPPELTRRAPALAALLWAGAGWFLRYLDRRRCQELFEEVRRRAPALAPSWEPAFASLLATIALGQPADDYRAQARRSLARFERAGDAWGQALALEVLSLAPAPEDATEAMQQARRSLRLRQRARDVWGMALSYFALGVVAEHADLLHLAERYFRESLRLRRKLGVDQEGALDCIAHLGDLARRTGRPETAARRFRQAGRLARDLGNLWRQVRVCEHTALLALDNRVPARASEMCEQGLARLARLDDPSLEARLHAVAALAAAERGDRTAQRAHARRARALAPSGAALERLPSWFLGPGTPQAVRDPWVVLAVTRGPGDTGTGRAAREATPAADREQALALAGAIATFARAKEPTGLAYALRGLAAILGAAGDADAAETVLALAARDGIRTAAEGEDLAARARALAERLR